MRQILVVQHTDCSIYLIQKINAVETSLLLLKRKQKHIVVKAQKKY